MSYSFGAQPASSHEETLSSLSDQHNVDRRLQHDRIQFEKQNTDSSGDDNMAGSSGADNITVMQRMYSATGGSIITSLLVTPLDVVRVRLQSQPPPPTPALNLSKFHAYSASFKKLPPNLGVTACCKEVFWVGDNGQFCLAGHGHGPPPANAISAECAVEETHRKTFHSTYDGLKKIAKNEGTLTLWRGLSPTLAMAIPANVIYFAGYDWLRYNKASPIKNVANDTYAPLVAGSVARVMAAIAVSPIEMFRTRMQATSGSASGIFKDTLVGLHKMTQTQGYTSLWRGLTLTMWRDVPFSAIYWWGYEAGRNYLSDARESANGMRIDTSRGLTEPRKSQRHEPESTTFIDSFTAGAVSGAIAAFVTTPFDVGKTRQQVYRHAGDDATSASLLKKAAAEAKVMPEELSMPKFLYHIFKEEGASGLFKGWAARCLKVAPACAIMISSYEIGKKWARKINKRKDEKTADL